MQIEEFGYIIIVDFNLKCKFAQQVILYTKCTPVYWIIGVFLVKPTQLERLLKIVVPCKIPVVTWLAAKLRKCAEPKDTARAIVVAVKLVRKWKIAIN